MLKYGSCTISGAAGGRIWGRDWADTAAARQTMRANKDAIVLVMALFTCLQINESTGTALWSSGFGRGRSRRFAENRELQDPPLPLFRRAGYRQSHVPALYGSELVELHVVRCRVAGLIDNRAVGLVIERRFELILKCDRARTAPFAAKPGRMAIHCQVARAGVRDRIEENARRIDDE